MNKKTGKAILIILLLILISTFASRTLGRSESIADYAERNRVAQQNQP